jgi:hypothetical protein
VLRAIISGGQTGGDQGGLAAAVVLGLRTGGWVPAGWRTEVGSEPWLASLGLREHRSRAYQPRTRANVEEGDGTLIFGNPHSPGCTLTARVARAKGKPLFLVEWRSGWPPPHPEDVADFGEWIQENGIVVLNVAGNRESSQPGIRDAARDFLVKALTL